VASNVDPGAQSLGSPVGVDARRPSSTASNRTAWRAIDRTAAIIVATATIRPSRTVSAGAQTGCKPFMVRMSPPTGTVGAGRAAAAAPAPPASITA
jgi:hypothetical protein